MSKKKSVHYIQLGIHLTKDLGLNMVTVDHNTTSLPSDSVLIKKLSFALLKSISLNKDDLALQDLLNELNIEKQKP